VEVSHSVLSESGKPGDHFNLATQFQETFL